jgi:cardiolipin synthase
MARHGAVNGERGRGCLPTSPYLLVLVVFAAGCQTPPARFAGEEPIESEVPRQAVLARQLAVDSALELGGHPLRTGAAAVTETAGTLAAAGQGAVAKRILLPLCQPPGPIDPARPTLDPNGLETDLKRQTGSALQPAHLAFSRDGPDALASLLRVIDGACCRIDVLMFLWENDAIGQAVAQRLAARATAGVVVRVLVDGGGNVIYSEGGADSAGEVNETVSWLARQPNVHLLRTRDGWARFDHRKLVVADGKVAWTGGRNFRVEAFAQQQDVSFLLSGPLAADLSREFGCFWKEQGGKPIHEGPRKVDPEEPAEACTDAARLVGTGPLRHDLADAIFLAIDHARHHVYIENPYLCDSRLLLRLVKARRRGVDVRVVLTLDTTPALASRANRVTANYLLRGGVRVYLYAGTTHVKAMSVDGLWAYVGTGNFDPLSLRHDYELGVALGGGPAVLHVEEEILTPDFRPEWELKEPLPVTARDCLSEIVACLFG